MKTFEQILNETIETGLTNSEWREMGERVQWAQQRLDHLDREGLSSADGREQDVDRLPETLFSAFVNDAEEQGS